MKRKNQTDPKGNIVPTIYLNFFGYRIWFEAKGSKQFIRNCILTKRICAVGEKAERQLLRLQELYNSICSD